MSQFVSPSVAWVRQEHANGCGVAAVAMLTGRSYGEVHDLMLGYREDWQDPSFDKHGVTYHEVNRALALYGYFTQLRYRIYAELGGWPPAPWAQLHYANVDQPSRNSHFVVMLNDGRVLDPLRDGFYSLADWSKVNHVVGLVRP